MPLARLPPLLLPNLPRPPPPPLSIAPTWIQIPLLLLFNLLRRLSLSLCVRFFPRFFVSLSVITYMEGGGKVFQTRSKRVSAMHRELMRKTSYFTVAWTTLSLSPSLSLSIHLEDCWLGWERERSFSKRDDRVGIIFKRRVVKISKFSGVDGFLGKKWKEREG